MSTIPTVIKPTIYIIAGPFAPSFTTGPSVMIKRGEQSLIGECGETVYRVHGVIGCCGNIRDNFNEKV
jgi:hypothetical protein